MKVIYAISELFKIYDHDYSVEHCTEFEPNRNYGDFLKKSNYGNVYRKETIG